MNLTHSSLRLLALASVILIGGWGCAPSEVGTVGPEADGAAASSGGGRMSDANAPAESSPETSAVSDR